MKTYSTTADILRDLADGYTLVYKPSGEEVYAEERKGLNKKFVFGNPSDWYRKEEPTYYYQWYIETENKESIYMSAFCIEGSEEAKNLLRSGWKIDKSSKRTFK